MTSQEVIAERIIAYLESDYRYAVLIDGPWGSGKTYYVDNVLSKRVKEKGYELCRATLFGVNTVEELAARVIQAYVSHGAVTVTSVSAGDAARSLSTVFGELLKSVTGLSFSATASMVASLLPWEGKLLVLDDLERCGAGNGSELVGFINDLVDRSACKVVFVSNYEKSALEVDSLEKLIWEKYEFRPDMQSMIGLLFKDCLDGLGLGSTVTHKLISCCENMRCQNVRALIRLLPIVEMVGRSGYPQEESVPKEVRLEVVVDVLELALWYAMSVFVSDEQIPDRLAYRRGMLAFVPAYFERGLCGEAEDAACQLRKYGNTASAGSAQRRLAYKLIGMVLGDEPFEDKEGKDAFEAIGQILHEQDLDADHIPLAISALERLKEYGLVDQAHVGEYIKLAKKYVGGHTDEAMGSILLPDSPWSDRANSDRANVDAHTGQTHGSVRSVRELRDYVMETYFGPKVVKEGEQAAAWLVEQLKASENVSRGGAEISVISTGVVIEAVQKSDARSIRKLSDYISEYKSRRNPRSYWHNAEYDWMCALRKELTDMPPLESTMRQIEVERLVGVLKGDEDGA